MKYKAIYDIIRASASTKMHDMSYWPKLNKNFVEQNRPLWIILENPDVNLRIWVTHDFGTMSISTAQLDLDCKSIAYYKSNQRYVCKSQSEMAELLRTLLNVSNASKLNEKSSLNK